MATLVLGTAQWGLDYGVTNAQGRVSDEELIRIVDAARDLGITLLDTAAGYGDAEERIAVAAPDLGVTTKVSGRSDVTVLEQVRVSLARLQRDHVARGLLHDWPDLSRAERRSAVDGLQSAREEGLVGAIGVSVYAEEDLAAADTEGLSVVQVPVNVLDQRLEGSDAIRAMRAQGWIIQARSALLQGVLAAPDITAFAGHRDVRAVVDLANRLGVRPMELAMAFVASRPWVDEIVVGVTTATELREIASVLEAPLDHGDWVGLASTDLDLIDPRRWPR